MTRREYRELYLYYHKRAEKGDVESQFRLGELYEYGRGVVKNIKLAEFWYHKAAEKKHPMAKLNLSWLRVKEECCFTGFHIPNISTR